MVSSSSFEAAVHDVVHTEMVDSCSSRSLVIPHCVRRHVENRDPVVREVADRCLAVKVSEVDLAVGMAWHRAPQRQRVLRGVSPLSCFNGNIHTFQSCRRIAAHVPPKDSHEAR